MTKVKLFSVLALILSYSGAYAEVCGFATVISPDHIPEAQATFPFGPITIFSECFPPPGTTISKIIWHFRSLSGPNGDFTRESSGSPATFTFPYKGSFTMRAEAVLNCGGAPCSPSIKKGRDTKLDAGFAIDKKPTADLKIKSACIAGEPFSGFDASDSIDPDNPIENLGPLEFLWVFSSQPSDLVTGATPTITVPSNIGNLHYRLRVANDYGISDYKEGDIECIARPVAIINQPLDRSVASAQAIETFSGSASFDPQNREITHKWSIVEFPSGAAMDTSKFLTGEITAFKLDDFKSEGSPANLPAGVYKFQLVVNNGIYDSNPRYFTISLDQYDFLLSLIQVGQATLDPQIHHQDGYDLVSGKNVVVRAVIGKKIPISQTDQNRIGVKARLQTSESQYVDLYGSFLAKDLSQTNSITVDLFHAGDFSLTGEGSIFVEVNPAIGIPAPPGGPNQQIPGRGEVDRSDNSTESEEFTGIKKFYTFTSKNVAIDFKAVDPPCINEPGCYSIVDLQSMNDLRSNTAKFVAAAFPIGKNKLSTAVGESITGSAKTSKAKGAIENDLNTLDSYWAILKNSVFSKIERFVGVVSPATDEAGYFDFHEFTLPNNKKPLGVFYWASPRAMLVEKDVPIIAAHELRHSLESFICDEGETCGHVPSINVDGYWVDYLDTANKGLKSFPSFLTEVVPRADANTLTRRWIDEPTYSSLFNELNSVNGFNGKIRVSSTTDRIHLNGILSREGDISVSNSFYYQTLEETSSAGREKIFLVDPLGNRISEFSFNGTTLVEAMASESGENENIFEASSAPFSVSIPFEAGAHEVQFLVKGKTKNVQPHGAILRKAVESIPVRGISGQSAQTKLELLNIVLEIELSFEAKNYPKAFVSLGQSLRPMVVQNVVDFTPVSPLEFTREKVLIVIDALLEKEAGLRTYLPFPKNILFSVSLDKQSYSVGDKAIFSAKVLKSPENSEYEFVIRAELDGAIQKIHTRDGINWFSTSSSLSPGLHSWKGRIFIQNKRETRSIKRAIEEHEQEIFKLQKEVLAETDPDKLQSMERQIAMLNRQVEVLELRISQLRKEIGSSLEVPIWIN